MNVLVGAYVDLCPGDSVGAPYVGPNEGEYVTFVGAFDDT